MPSDPASISPLRRHQREAIEALEAAWAQDHTRCWVVLPPGAGKTRVGLEASRRVPGITRTVVLSPNTAIQAQWAQQAHDLGIDAGTDRSLTHTLTALTYQSLAVFDADDEIDDEGEQTSLLARLHDNGRALVATLRGAGPILLVLDECHHLLEVWGRLLEELLAELPEAWVLGLTATPPGALTGDQLELVDGLFGRSVYEASIPAVVREGDLAPFAEMVWLTEPTPREREWLRAGAERFSELVTQLSEPDFGSTGFLTWIDLRFLSDDVSWAELGTAEPELCDAALRMHHAGLLALPRGARINEQHRHEPTPEDWGVLIEDWIEKGLAGGDDTGDDSGDSEVVAAVRRALPSVGLQWTKRGIRRGRTPVDRVLARSAAKMSAAVEITLHEHAGLGERMRTLVLCDHERASATLPADLRGVIDQQSGSAYAVLAGLVAEPQTALLAPLMVTGATVAGSPDTLDRLRTYAEGQGLSGADRLVVEEVGDGLAHLTGSWSSRSWVPVVTAFFQAGHTQVIVGTRALLGEGWDARRITGLIDLSAATTTTSVVQTRGRALRVDPLWEDKVALNWSVVCVAEDHPKGHNDWDRLVRKHDGFLAVDDEGDIVDGVAHIDPALSPFAPPPSAEFDAVNARMLVRAEQRDAIRELWRVGEPYVDRLGHTLRILPSDPAVFGTSVEPAAVVPVDGALELRVSSPPRPSLKVAGALATLALVLCLGAWSTQQVALLAPAALAMAAAGTLVPADDHGLRSFARPGRGAAAQRHPDRPRRRRRPPRRGPAPGRGGGGAGRHRPRGPLPLPGGGSRGEPLDGLRHRAGRGGVADRRPALRRGAPRGRARAGVRRPRTAGRQGTPHPGRRGLARGADGPGTAQGVGHGLRGSLGPLGRLRAAGLHPVAGGSRHPGRPAGCGSLPCQHRGAPAVGLSSSPVSRAGKHDP